LDSPVGTVNDTRDLIELCRACTNNALQTVLRVLLGPGDGTGVNCLLGAEAGHVHDLFFEALRNGRQTDMRLRPRIRGWGAPASNCVGAKWLRKASGPTIRRLGLGSTPHIDVAQTVARLFVFQLGHSVPPGSDCSSGKGRIYLA
jgi:hypothetical protein